MKHLGCQKYSVKTSLTALSPGNRRLHRIFFKVSEEEIVTGSQVWTVGWMVKLYEVTFLTEAHNVHDLCAGALSWSSSTPPDNFPWRFCSMVKLYELTFPYSSPRCAWLVCGCIVMKQQDTTRTFHGISVQYFCIKPPLWKVQVSPVMVALCGMNSKGITLSEPKNLLPRSFRLIVAHKIPWEQGTPYISIAWTLVWSLDHDDGPMFHPL